MKIKTIGAIIITIGFFAGILFFINSRFNVPPPVATQNNLTGAALEMSVSSVTESDSFFAIRAEYPQFKGVDTSFNQKISDLITKQISDFKQASKDNWEARRATADANNPVPENPTQPFDFEATWTPNQLNARYLSFVIHIYSFSGGAHGDEMLYTFNYDLANRKEITINDFLNSDTNALSEISKLSVDQITSQLQSSGMEINDNVKQMISDGTKPTPENFKDFNFNANELIIYFQKYQVAPGVAGPITVSLFKPTLEANSVKSDYLK